MMTETPTLHLQSAIPAVSSLHNLTPAELHTLSALCSAAKATAYCPYSRFRVGATFLTTDGQYFSGANVENASYPVGTCAERVALGKAVTELAMTVEGDGGFKAWRADKGQDGAEKGFKALAVATDISPPASPCGMCRQFIREFCDVDMPIYMFDKDGSFQVIRLEQLLPMSFGPEALPQVFAQ